MTTETDENYLYHADETCEHNIVPNGWSGVICTKCRGWFCY